MKHLVEDKEEQFTKTQVLELEGSPVREEGYDKDLSELEVKLQQQLDSFVEEIQCLKLCIEEKHSELDVEQLKEFDLTMLAKDQKLQSLRSLLLSKSKVTHGKSSELFSTLAANATRPNYSTSRVSETLPNVGELLFNVPAAQTTSVTPTHSVPTLLSTGGATRFPPPIQSDYRPRLVTTGKDRPRYSEQRYTVRQPQGNLNQNLYRILTIVNLNIYVCNSPNHLARDCKVQKTESEGKSNLPRKNGVIRGSNHPGVITREKPVSKGC